MTDSTDDVDYYDPSLEEGHKRSRRTRRIKPESDRPPVQKYPYSDWIKRLNAVFPPRGGYIEPLSEDWRQARRGRLTASKRAEIIYNRRPAEWNALMDELNAELSPDYQWTEARGKALDWGREHEKAALANIMLDHGRDVEDPGLLFHTEHPWIAATPDGIITEGRKRISVQVKCPYFSRNHTETLYTKTLRPVYYAQVQHEAWVSRADAIEFYSFDPRQPRVSRLVRVDVPVNSEFIARLEKNALDFAAAFCAGHRFGEGASRPLGVMMPYG